MDIAKRFTGNPLLTVKSLEPAIEGMEIACILNPGVFRYRGRTWLVLRVAERPVQQEGSVSFPVYDENGNLFTEDHFKPLEITRMSMGENILNVDQANDGILQLSMVDAAGETIVFRLEKWK